MMVSFSCREHIIANFFFQPKSRRARLQGRETGGESPLLVLNMDMWESGNRGARGAEEILSEFKGKRENKKPKVKP